jgi:amino acid transporter
MQPRRTLNFSGLVALTFFCVAGGAYGIEDAVGAAGPRLALAGLLLIPLLWSLPTALMTAELSSAMPEDGGYVVWVERAFGRFWGFQEGWLSWVCSFADNALYPVMFVDYFAYLTGEMGLVERWLIGMSVVSVITWCNIRGIQLVGRSLILFGFLVLAPFAVMVVLGTPRVESSIWLQASPDVNWALLLSVLLWNTCGWDNAGCCAGEVRGAAKIYYRAMIVALALVTFSYVLPVAVGVGVEPGWEQWKEGHLPEVAEKIGGAGLATWVTLTGLVSALGLFNALLCTSARVPYAMALRRTLPSFLARLHPSHGTPWASILVNSAVVAVLIPFSFQELVQVDMFLYALALVLEFAALIRLRWVEPDMARPYRIPFRTPGVIALSVPPVGLCLASILIADTPTRLVSLAAIGLGLLAYAALALRGHEAVSAQVSESQTG